MANTGRRRTAARSRILAPRGLRSLYNLPVTVQHVSELLESLQHSQKASLRAQIAAAGALETIDARSQTPEARERLAAQADEASQALARMAASLHGLTSGPWALHRIWSDQKHIAGWSVVTRWKSLWHIANGTTATQDLDYLQRTGKILAGSQSHGGCAV